MKVYLCKATLQESKGGPKLACLAKLESPGVWSVTQFLLVNGAGELTIHRGEVWQYDLNIHSAVSVQSGAATFDFD